MYYVGFLDILGFKKIVCEKEEKDILNIFEQIQCIIDNLKKEFDIVPIFYRIMSDSIVVACDDSIPPALTVVLYCCGKIQELLLANGILLRGGVSHGKFYYNEAIMYGKGLVSAYELENNISKYPRIVVDTSSIIEYKSKMKDTDVYFELFNLLEKDTQDIYYIDTALMYLHDISQKELIYRIKKKKELLEKNLLNIKLPLNVREKYIWIKDEFNDFMKRNPQYSSYQIKIDVK